MSARLLFQNAIGFTGAWREVHFDKMQARADIAFMRGRFAAQQAWLRELAPDKRILTVSVISADAVTMIDGELRSVVDESVKQLAPRIRAAALVIEATGLKGAVFRSIVAGLSLVAGARYETKTEPTLEGALRWLAPQLDADGGRAPTYDELYAAWREIEGATAKR